MNIDTNIKYLIYQRLQEFQDKFLKSPHDV